MRPELGVRYEQQARFPTKLERNLVPYARHEGLHVHNLVPGILQIKENARNERRVARQEKIEKRIEQLFDTAESATRRFYNTVTFIRTHTPDAMPLNPWEEHYLKTYYPDVSKYEIPPKAFWRKLKKEGVDARQMKIVSL